MQYYLFLDESGDHGLAKFDPDFPVFLLCGVLVSEAESEIIRQKINTLKQSIWSNKEVIFHSRDIRKCEIEFQKLFDLDIKKRFYEELNIGLLLQKITIAQISIQLLKLLSANYISS